ncbi:glycoside hydrolase family 5 protein [Victivallis vadensis]|uniref:Glycoside hydrolase family 5 protein n=1 Tax=Victivallis vadensis TaxID=172901 RepID=A0A848B3T8_9BACT|nr:cellulase family glycosylhydrolase [Victivallis vadensis]NMD88279.1 glycoside hydrolase family 5 protein [Victivallis vadensis]
MQLKRFISQIFKFIVCTVAGIFAFSVTAKDALPPPLPEFSSLAKAKWNLGKYGRKSVKNGRVFLTIDVPSGSPDKENANCAETQINLSKFRAEPLCFIIKARAKDVSEPQQNYNGVKFMVNYKDGIGDQFWYNTNSLKGTFDWQDISFVAQVSESASHATLSLGLQDSTGEVEFDLSTLRVFRLFPRVNQNYKVGYSKEIAGTPLLRGVMSPASAILTDDDLRTLHEWNVRLVRVQLNLGWDDWKAADLNEYDKWLNNKLDQIEDMFKRAEKYDIKFVIDLHSAPGGKSYDLDQRVFYEKKYTDHFLLVWERIAKRFKDNSAVWAYDLINEPIQSHPTQYDYWNLQRAAAESIRKIDPTTPIVVVSNAGNDPSAFSYLSPLAMDNVIYQVHMYLPNRYTHQLLFPVFGELLKYPGMIGKEKWDKKMIRKHLKPVRDFQLRHNARIYVGEFSAVAWAPGAADYLRDCIEVFEEYGWDWTYHAFREDWGGWSVEHEATKPSDLKPAKEDTLRKKVLLEYFRRNR